MTRRLMPFTEKELVNIVVTNQNENVREGKDR